jgi:general L-amino acid transport system substrate-binding protein
MRRLAPLPAARCPAALCLAALCLAAPLAQAQAQTLEAVKRRGQVVCGTSTGTAGFDMPDSRGIWHGMMADFCRAVAAAVLGDAERVRFIPLAAPQRFAALVSGEIDILTRTTTWTLQRDAGQGMNFTAPLYYDGQGFLVPRRLGVTDARQLDGASICLTAGTTSEANVVDWSRANRIGFRPVVFERNEEARAAYLAGRCDVYSTDVSILSATRATLARDPGEHVILAEIISKEPLTPVVRQGDDQWFDIVRFVQFALIEAEERGITRASLAEAMGSPNPDIRRLLGVTPGNGRALGLDESWAALAIRAVGNYGEMFDRNLGPATPLGLARGPNALWTHGGLMYAPPLR